MILHHYTPNNSKFIFTIRSTLYQKNIIEKIQIFHKSSIYELFPNDAYIYHYRFNTLVLLLL